MNSYWLASTRLRADKLRAEIRECTGKYNQWPIIVFGHEMCLPIDFPKVPPVADNER